MAVKTQREREYCCSVWITAMVAVLSVLWEIWLALWTYDLRLLQSILERTLLLDGLRILAAPWGLKETTGTTPDHTAEHICWQHQASQLDTDWSNQYGLESAALVALCTLNCASQKWWRRRSNLFRAGVGMDAFCWTGFNSYWDTKRVSSWWHHEWHPAEAALMFKKFRKVKSRGHTYRKCHECMSSCRVAATYWHSRDGTTLCYWRGMPRVGSGVVRMDPLRFLARCRKGN